MIRLAICDDETIFAKKLKKCVETNLDKRGISYQTDLYRSGEDFVAQGVKIVDYTVVFLDINMTEMDGLMVAQRIRDMSREVLIVFVTAYVTYTLEGYKFDAVRYLLKGAENFQNTVDECMDAIVEKLNYKIVKKTFKFNEAEKEVSLDRLLYIESKLHKLEFHVMEDGMKIYTLYKTLNEISDEFAEYDFIRIHQSFLVNLKYIKKVMRYKVILMNQQELSIPKARYKIVKDTFVAYRGEL
jgi:DNA-binding LytR/AlgR family response regulator